MKHSIICFISLMMTVFCYARTSIYQLPSDSTDWKVYYMQGEKYHRKGKLQKSLSNYKKALSIHVSDTIVHALANCYYQRGYYQQSIELYNTFIKKRLFGNQTEYYRQMLRQTRKTRLCTYIPQNNCNARYRESE